MSIQLDFTKFYNVIDGKLTTTAETLSTVNPSTEERLPPVPRSTPKDVDDAVAAAQRAAPAWADVPWEGRSKAVRAFADALEARLDDFAKLLTAEQGKPLLFAKGEIAATVEFFRGFSELDMPEVLVEDNESRRMTTRYVPIGVVVGIVPWNYPVHLAGVKIGHALLTGNTFILKPSPFTPYSNLKLAELGLHFFPPAVFQVLSGDDQLGPWLTAHAGVGKVSFTGSTATGRKVMESCSRTLKRLTLELGGNDPAIVCADNDPAALAPQIATFALINSGQICIAIKRVYVHEAVYDDFLAALVAYVDRLGVGDGNVPTNFLGPLNNKLQFERVRNLLEDVDRTGLKVVTGSTKPVDGKGYFFVPTIVDNPPEDSRLVLEEPFGPVFPVLKWSDEADVIRRANNTEYGLGASVWSRDTAQAERIARKLQAGAVWINTHAEATPRTSIGGHKQSGLGCESGLDGMKGYCNVQTFVTKK